MTLSPAEPICTKGTVALSFHILMQPNALVGPCSVAEPDNCDDDDVGVSDDDEELEVSAFWKLDDSGRSLFQIGFISIDCCRPNSFSYLMRRWNVAMTFSVVVCDISIKDFRFGCGCHVAR